MQEIGKRIEKTPSLVPYLTVSDGAAALAFYERAFGAEVAYRSVADDGVRIMHAQLAINGDELFLSDHFAEYSGGAPAPVPAGVMLHLNVTDADAWWARAVEAGATVIMPLADQFWGDRYGQLKDPFGHSWSISAPTRG